jgi:heme/copper-type cytochrome/quinol oxidase subunit 2
MRLSFADGLFWLSVACCAVAQILIIRSVQLARSRSETPVVASRSRYGVELLWAVLPAVALAVLLVFTWRAMREPQRNGPEAAQAMPSGA